MVRSPQSNGHNSPYAVGYREGGIAFDQTGAGAPPWAVRQVATNTAKTRFKHLNEKEFVRGFVDGYFGHPYDG